MTSYSLKRAHFHWLFALALLLIPAAAPAKNLDSLLNVLDKCLLERDIYETGAPDKPCGVGRADANPKLLLNDT